METTLPCSLLGEAYLLLGIRRKLKHKNMKGAENDLDIVHEEVNKRYAKEIPSSDAEEEDYEEQGGDGDE